LAVGVADQQRVLVVVLEYWPKGLFERTGNLRRAQGRRARLELKHFRRHAMTDVILWQEEIEGWRGEIRDSEVVKTHEEALKAERAQEQPSADATAASDAAAESEAAEDETAEEELPEDETTEEELPEDETADEGVSGATDEEAYYEADEGETYEEEGEEEEPYEAEEDYADEGGEYEDEGEAGAAEPTPAPSGRRE
jgi:hypothetical protein